MNVSSTPNNPVLQSASPFEYSTIALGILLLVSEVLPFLKSKGNGITEKIVCLLRGSECVAKKVADTLETKEEQLPSV